MDLVLSTYLWVSPAILFKRYPHKWGQLDSDFSPQSLCPLCGKLYSLLFSSFFLSVFLSFSLSVSPFPIALLSTRLGAPCTPDNAAPLSYTPAPLLVSLSLSSGWLFPSCQVVCLCVFLLWVRSSCLCRGMLFLRMLALTATGLFVQGLELAEIPASPAPWSSTNCILEPYNRCLPHGLPQLWMAKREAGCVPRP